ncbi:Translin [Heliocybe sulcata]|uniref:Translin n=1 Tax=Heliocybe sulcata TaxID=5364 RepID=A0A5C3N464_9AGAM|nr:Translin [Heliocybe sulcata]
MDPQDLEFINRALDSEVELRDKIRDEVSELDKKTRSMVGVLNKVHSTPPEQISDLVDSVRPSLKDLHTTTGALYALVPPDQFWRWKDMWSNSMRSAVFSATLMEYLTSGTLMSMASVSAALGNEWKDRFALPAEDYLHGLITLVNELSRLAVNAVTLGSYEEPIRISKFVKDLFTGFSMLNLKNDALRRRYDSLKYDLKKIEEVVYDVSLRKLASAK